MIIFGFRSKPLGAVAERIDATCDHCGHSRLAALVFQRYFHVYWIPVLPTGKSVFFECAHCKRVIEDGAREPTLARAAEKARGAAATPFLMYTGAAVLVAIFMIAALRAG
jgi:hypothetical protein